MKKSARQEMLLKVHQELVKEAKVHGGSVVHYTLQGQRYDYDFTVIRADGSRKNIKVYTTTSASGNTAIGEKVINNGSIHYIILYAEGYGLCVFKRQDVVNAGNLTTDGRKHFSSILNNMPSQQIVLSAYNFRRLFLDI